MPSPTPAQRELLAHRDHRHARLWRVSRTDGEVYLYTDCNRTIHFRGEDYLPVPSAVSADVETRSRLQESSSELVGALADEGLSLEDMILRRFDGAYVVRYEVDWMYPWLGALEEDHFEVSRGTHTGESWNLELGGIARRLESKKGSRFQKDDCDLDLGGRKCGVDRVPLSNFYVEIAAVLDPFTFVTEELAPVRANGWFRFGDAVFRSGALEGTTWIVDQWNSSTRQITLQQRLEILPQVGDRVDLWVGCSRTWLECTGKFNNGHRNGSFRWMKGTNEVLKPAAS